MDTPEKSHKWLNPDSIPEDADIWLTRSYITSYGILYQASSRPYKASSLPKELLNRPQFYSLTNPNPPMEDYVGNVVESQPISFSGDNSIRKSINLKLPNPKQMNGGLLKNPKEIFVEKAVEAQIKPPLDLRSASLKELVELSYVGVSLAKRLMKFLEENPSIDSLEELDNHVKLPFGKSWKDLPGITLSKGEPSND